MVSYKVKVKTYTQASPGLHDATLARILDAGVRPSKYGPKDQFDFDFIIADEVEAATGAPITIRTCVNKESGPKSKLRKLIAGLHPTLKPVDGEWDIAPLIGRACQLLVKHDEKPDGRVFSNIAGILPPKPGTQPLVIPPEYSSPASTETGADYFSPAEEEAQAESVPNAASVSIQTSEAELRENIAGVRRGRPSETKEDGATVPSEKQ